MVRLNPTSPSAHPQARQSSSRQGNEARVAVLRRRDRPAKLLRLLLTASDEAAPNAEQGAMPSRILIVDDHPVMLEGLRDLLSREVDLVVCGEAQSALATFEAIERLTPDLVILDLMLGSDDDLQVVGRLHARWPQLRILVLSMQDEALFAERIISMGARGYVMKMEAAASVLAAVRKILAGEYYLSPALGNRIFSRRPGARHAARVVRALTARERQVLLQIATGKTTQEISRHLGINAKTVDSHRRSMRDKLGLASASELIRYAIQWSKTDEADPPGAASQP